MSDGSQVEGAEQRIAPLERKEAVGDTAFILKLDKAGLEADRTNIAPEGQATLDAILELPDVLSFPNETTLIIGPNGIGKSTLLGAINLVGEANSVMRMRNRMNSEYKWEDAIGSATSGRMRTETDRKKMGIAPNIAKHMTIVDGADNLGTVRFWRIPEEAGREWNELANDEMGTWDSAPVVTSSGAREVLKFTKGTMAKDAGIVGSTQQIVDRKVFRRMEEDIKRGRGPFTVLLDEPTANADLARSLGLLDELNDVNTRVENRAHFIIASNEGLMALNRNVPRIDMGHPERGVHLGRDFPLEESTAKALRSMGYASLSQ